MLHPESRGFGWLSEFKARFFPLKEPQVKTRQEIFFRHPDGPLIHVCPTPDQTYAAAVANFLDILEKAKEGDAVLLATGDSYLPFYTVLIARAKNGVNLAQFRWGHIDNFAYDAKNYPEGTGEQDYEKFLRRHFIEPAGIPNDHLFPIGGLTANATQTAREYNQWLEKQRIIAALMGLGPEPVVHIAYMKPDMDLEQGVAAIELSPETVARNEERAKKEGKLPPPKTAITLGLPHLRRAEHKFVLACGDGYAERVRLALAEEINPNIIATYLRTEGFRDTVDVYLDATSAKHLKLR